MLSWWRRTRPWTRVVAAVVLVAVVGGGAWWFLQRGDDAQAASTEPTTQSVAASLTTLEKSVSASGTLTPSVQEDVSFAVSGTVTAVSVAAGDTVAAGQQLATVDTLSLDADVLSAKADLASAKADLADAQDAADGTDSSDAQIAALKAKVEVAQTAVDDANAAVSDAVLVAPVAGLLTEVNLAVGDAVTGTGSSSSGSASGGTGSTGTAQGGAASSGTTTSTTSSAQFVIVGTDSWQIAVTVGESDIALIASGDQAEITVDDSTDPLYGTVSAIGLLPSTSGGVAAYPVTVTVTGSPTGLHDGVSADVSIVYERRTDVLTVPSAAVTTDDDGQTVVTQEDAEGKQVTKVVTVGETSGSTTEITDGLAEGDEVLVTVFRPQSTGEGSGDDSQQQGGYGGFGGGTGEFPGGGTGEFPGGGAGGFSGGGQAGGRSNG